MDAPDTSTVDKINAINECKKQRSFIIKYQISKMEAFIYYRMLVYSQFKSL